MATGWLRRTSAGAGFPLYPMSASVSHAPEKSNFLPVEKRPEKAADFRLIKAENHVLQWLGTVVPVLSDEDNLAAPGSAFGDCLQGDFQ